MESVRVSEKFTFVEENYEYVMVKKEFIEQMQSEQ